jgi:DNA-binding FrmR family transcriptional regulator
MADKKQQGHTHTHVAEDGTICEHAHTHVAEDGTVYEHTHTHVAEDGTVYEHTHTDVAEDGTVYEHTHTHSGEAGHSHHHTHTHENTKAVLNRLARVIGHLESIRRMVEDGRDCSEVLIQLSAVRAAINNTGKVILQDHIQHCLVDAIESGDMQEIEELNKAIDRFVK